MNGLYHAGGIVNSGKGLFAIGEEKQWELKRIRLAIEESFIGWQFPTEKFNLSNNFPGEYTPLTRLQISARK